MTGCKRFFRDAVRLLRLLLSNLDGFFSHDLAQIGSHIEFDLRGVRAVRQHDGRIAYAASAKLHLIFHLDLAVLHHGQGGRNGLAGFSDYSQSTAVLVLQPGGNHWPAAPILRIYFPLTRAAKPDRRALEGIGGTGKERYFAVDE